MKNLLTGNSVKKLQQKSASILDVFTSTVNQLRTVNETVEKEAVIREMEKERIEKELSELQTIKSNNEAVINKISKILE